MADRDLDELWRKAETYGSKIKESLEVAQDFERRSFSEVITKLFYEYRDLKAIFERVDEAYGKLRRDYMLQATALDERTRELAEANRKIEELKRQV